MQRRLPPPIIRGEAAPRPAILSQRAALLKTKWRPTLDLLHLCRKSRNYYTSMVVDDGEWDFTRDVSFTMNALMPDVIELLTAPKRPTVEDMKKVPWVDTDGAGVYSATAVKIDRFGNVVAVRLKIGNAWSFDSKGMNGRRRTHENPANSAKEALKGSHFHAFLNSCVDGETIQIHWSTLAMGPAVRRETEEDEYTAGRWYQIKSMLSAAFGASMMSMKNDKYLELSWWPWLYTDADPPWSGVDGHNAIEDRWHNRPGETVQDQQSIRNAATKRCNDTAIRLNRFPCRYSDCERSVDLQEFISDAERDRHHKAHERYELQEAAAALDNAKHHFCCTYEGCERSQNSRRLPHQNALDDHLRMHEKKDARAAKPHPFSCTYADCERSEVGRQFRSQKDIDFHLASHKKKEAARITATTYLCTWVDCDRHQPAHGFMDMAEYHKHLLAHAKLDPIRPHTAADTKHIRADVAKTIRDQAVASDGFLCKKLDCDRGRPGKGFHDQNSLNRHVATHKKRSLPPAFLCTYVDCERSQPGREFCNQGSLDHHIATHDKAVEGVHLCPHPGCNRSVLGRHFTSPSDLARHVLTHRPGNKRLRKS